MMCRRATKVELRYVPMAMKEGRDNERYVLMVAMLVITQGRLTQSSMLGRRSSGGAMVLPLQRHGVVLRLVTESKSSAPPFAFSLESVRLEPDLKTEVTTQVLFRAVNASEYALWKQALGVAIAMPVVRIKLAAQEPSMTLATAINTLDCLPEKDDGEEPELIDELIERADAFVLSRTDMLGKHMITNLTEDSEEDTLNEHDVCDDYSGQQDSSEPASLQFDAFALSTYENDVATAASVNSRNDHEENPSESRPVCAEPTTALPALRIADMFAAVAPTTVEATTVPSQCEDIANELTMTHIQEQSTMASQTEDCSIPTTGICVESIVKHFEAFSWPLDKRTSVASRDTRRQLSLTHSRRSNRHWKSTKSMPSAFHSNLFDEISGYSWLVTAPSLLQRERCEQIRKTNSEVQRRVRALVRNQSLDEVAEPCCWPALLPRLVVSPVSPPPSLLSTYDEFFCQ